MNLETSYLPLEGAAPVARFFFEISLAQPVSRVRWAVRPSPLSWSRPTLCSRPPLRSRAARRPITRRPGRARATTHRSRSCASQARAPRFTTLSWRLLTGSAIGCCCSFLMKIFRLSLAWSQPAVPQMIHITAEAHACPPHPQGVFQLHLKMYACLPPSPHQNRRR